MMRRLSVVFAVVVLLSMSVSAYGEEFNSSDGENAIIKFKEKSAQDVPVGSDAYIREIYTTTAPGILEQYNTSAVKTFSLGSNVHLVVRFHLAGIHSYSTIIIISNAAGRIMYLDTLSGMGQDLVNDFTTSSPPPYTGTYVLNALILDNTTGQFLLPTAGFPFVVE